MAIEHVTRHAVKAVERQQQCIDLIKVSLYELEQGRTDLLGNASESRRLIREIIPSLVRAVAETSAGSCTAVRVASEKRHLHRQPLIT